MVQVTEEVCREALDHLPFGRYGTVYTIVDAAVDFDSDAACYELGTRVKVDGGRGIIMASAFNVMCRLNGGRG